MWNHDLFLENIDSLVKKHCGGVQQRFNDEINDRDAITKWKGTKKDLPKKPSLSTVFKIIDKFPCSLDWLLTGKEFTEPEPNDETREAMANVKEILESKHEIIVPALKSNLCAFIVTVRLAKAKDKLEKESVDMKRENKTLIGDVAQLKKEMRHLKRLDTPKQEPISGEVNGAGT